MSLLDFLQSASNAVAGNVTGPVDLITLALRKAGVPVPEDAVGTSAWAKGKGLVRDVEPGAARVAGETAGILGPMLAVHYAPQIASGLLKASENAAAPRTLNPQTGAIVWHGSPHKFDKFDSSKIGTGEGAQAYGHGLYLAESPDVAASYRNALADTLEVKGQAPALEKRAAQMALTFGDNTTEGALAWLSKFEGKGANHVSPAMTPELVQAVKSKFLDGTFKRGGALYKVDLPDEAIARMLDWDKPLSKQAPGVREAIREYEQMLKQAGYVDPQGATDGLLGKGMYESLGYAMRDKAISAGKNSQTTLQAMQDNASRALKAAGIPGIKYLDGGSRGAGQGTSNYVVFDDSLLTILERNGIPIR